MDEYKLKYLKYKIKYLILKKDYIIYGGKLQCKCEIENKTDQCKCEIYDDNKDEIKPVISHVINKHANELEKKIQIIEEKIKKEEENMQEQLKKKEDEMKKQLEKKAINNLIFQAPIK